MNIPSAAAEIDPDLPAQRAAILACRDRFHVRYREAMRSLRHDDPPPLRVRPVGHDDETETVREKSRDTA